MWATKYRPTKFEEVIGQDKAIKVLKTSVGKSNTYILHGDSGVGKTTLARIFANFVDGEILEINGANTNGVDDVRGLISSASYIPALNEYRVFIIDECHMLTIQAWNALLKILEESPKSTLWVLCTTEYAKVPPTIKSRGIDVTLEPIKKDAIVKHLLSILKSEGIDEYVDEDIDRIASWSEGRLREAITQCETYVNTGELNLPFSTLDIIELLTNVFDGKTTKVIDKINHLTNQDVYAIIKFISDYMKLLLVRHDLPQSVTTKSILEDYTSIAPSNIDKLRVLQDSVWKASTGDKEQWRNSLDLIYSFYDKMTRHYNDFRDARASVTIAMLHTVGESL